MEDRIAEVTDELVALLGRRFATPTEAGACLALTLTRIVASTDADVASFFELADAVARRRRS